MFATDRWPEVATRDNVLRAPGNCCPLCIEAGLAAQVNADRRWVMRSRIAGWSIPSALRSRRSILPSAKDGETFVGFVIYGEDKHVRDTEERRQPKASTMPAVATRRRRLRTDLGRR